MAASTRPASLYPDEVPVSSFSSSDLSGSSTSPGVTCLHNGNVYRHKERFTSSNVGLKPEHPDQCVQCSCEVSHLFYESLHKMYDASVHISNINSLFGLSDVLFESKSSVEDDPRYPPSRIFCCFAVVSPSGPIRQCHNLVREPYSKSQVETLTCLIKKNPKRKKKET